MSGTRSTCADLLHGRHRIPPTFKTWCEPELCMRPPTQSPRSNRSRRWADAAGGPSARGGQRRPPPGGGILSGRWTTWMSLGR